MIEHLSKPQLERLSVRVLPPSELTLSTQHLAICQFCRRQYQGIREMRRGGSIVRITLAPELWLRHEHLEYEQLVALADQTMAAEDLELASLHIKICARCREDMRSFFAFREDIASELKVSYGPTLENKPEKVSWFGWWGGLSWQLRYAAVIALIAVVVASLALWKHRANMLEARRNGPQTIEPNNHNQLPATASHPTNETAATSPTVSGNNDAERHGVTPNGNRETVVPKNDAIQSQLRDTKGIVAISETGAVTGLEDVSESTRRDVAVALRSQSLPRSAMLNQLTDKSSSLRGRADSESFSLISPARTVIVDHRPVFRWERFSRAANYRVYVTDSAGKVVVKSDLLGPTINQWTFSAPLKRGEIYSWAVVALVDGKEIVSPNASTSEIRFQILSSSDLDQLAALRKSGSHLALGVFCARVGLISEAEAELKELLRLNPDSKLIRRLLAGLKRDH
jgi:hypothetical protein